MPEPKTPKTWILAENQWVPLKSAPPHACPYLSGREMTLDLGIIIPDAATFDTLLARGHRRLGQVFYRPACDDCRECLPIRIPVADFSPSKSQRRTWRKLAERYTVKVHPPTYDPGHFDLYRRHALHVATDNPPSDPESYERAFLLSQVNTHLLEYRVDDELVAVSVVDEGARALSSVYVFWDPDKPEFSPGTFSALWELRWAQAIGKDAYYLGYWVRDCSHMNYKSRFRPFELYDWRDDKWCRFNISKPDIISAAEACAGDAR
ncbi:MAG: arginyltransferase [Deltaproteobacteria bacterium]|nr:arginyltransferase [Deltaproteobacteria bacterium]